MSATSRDRNRTSRVAAILIGIVVAIISICTVRNTAAEEPRRIAEAREAEAEIQRPEAPVLLSVEVIPDATASSANAMLQNGDGAVAPIAVDLETTNPHNAP